MSIQEYQFNQLVASIGISAEVKAQEKSMKAQNRLMGKRRLGV